MCPIGFSEPVVDSLNRRKSQPAASVRLFDMGLLLAGPAELPPN